MVMSVHYVYMYTYVCCVVDRFAELQHYSALQFSPAADSAECHIIIDKPSILIKLDAGLSLCLSACLSGVCFSIFIARQYTNVRY